MHVAGTATYEAGSLRTPDGGIDIDRIRAYVDVAPAPHPALPPAARIHPDREPPGLGRRRPLQHPLPRAPHRAAAARRRAAAQAPGGAHHVAAPRSLEAAVGDLDRRRARRRRALRDDQQDPPLHGRRHVERRPAERAASARADRGLRAAARLDPATGADGDWSCCATPLYRYARCRSRSGATRRRSSAKRAIRARTSARDAARRARHARHRLAEPFDTPLNQPIGPHRRFDWLAMDLDEVKAVKNRLGGTLNDVVLATVAGAVRRFLERRRVQLEDLDFRVMAPVSVRTRSRARQRSATASRRGWCRCRSASAIRAAAREDPRDHGALKESKQALGAESADRGRRVDAVDPAVARRAHGHAPAAVQPRRHQRAGTAGAALHARRAHARQLRAGAADRLSLSRHRALQLRRASSAGASPPTGTCSPTCTTSCSTSRRRFASSPSSHLLRRRRSVPTASVRAVRPRAMRRRPRRNGAGLG